MKSSEKRKAKGDKNGLQVLLVLCFTAKSSEMVYIGFYLVYIVVILLLFIYLKLVYECKRGVKLSVEVLKKVGKKSQKENLQRFEVLPQPPGPVPWPVLGNLALLGQYEVPFEGFSALSKIYGDIYSLTLGTTRCVVVNSLDTIKEVLNQKGKYFGGRPNFEVKSEHSFKLGVELNRSELFLTAFSPNLQWRSKQL